MVMCCPLSGSGDDSASFYEANMRRARKVHACEECNGPIGVGDEHEYVKGLWDGQWSTFRTCLSCKEIRDHFACDGFMFGQLWSDLAENFFPDMRCGGQCMDDLSPEAKNRIIDKRMEWYFDQGEIDDSRWEDFVSNKARQVRPTFEPVTGIVVSQRGIELDLDIVCTSEFCVAETWRGVARRGGLSESLRIVRAKTLDEALRALETFDRECRRHHVGNRQHG